MGNYAANFRLAEARASVGIRAVSAARFRYKSFITFTTRPEKARRVFRIIRHRTPPCPAVKSRPENEKRRRCCAPARASHAGRSLSVSVFPSVRIGRDTQLLRDYIAEPS